MGEVVYLDYLDKHLGLSPIESDFNRTINHLKFDMLANPDSVLGVAAPALAKSKLTFSVAQTIRGTSRSRDFKLFLSPAARGSLAVYTAKRSAELERSFDERDLLKSFEYQGYNSDHWRELANNADLGAGAPLFYDRPNSADAAFRLAVSNRIDEYGFDREIGDAGVAKILIDEVKKRASNNADLFQRELLLSQFGDELHLGFSERSALQRVLDRAFDQANSESIGGKLWDDRSMDSGDLQRILSVISGAWARDMKSDFQMRPIGFSADVSRSHEWGAFLNSISRVAQEVEAIDASKLRRQLATQTVFRWSTRAGRSILIAAIISAVFEIPAWPEVIEFLGAGLISFGLDSKLPIVVRMELIESHRELIAQMKRIAQHPQGA